MVEREKKKNEELMTVVKGTRDFMPREQIVRERILDTLKETFKLYGYKPIETSILESFEVAALKFGGGFEILNETYRLSDSGHRDLCLRYELTFKLAKLFANNRDIKLPFKRYEIGKVFRDGPVKSDRLREFTQCDVDVIGMKSMSADAELLAMISHVFSKLDLQIRIELNDRKILFGIFEICGVDKDKHSEVSITIDKLSKIGEVGVARELLEKGLIQPEVDRIFDMFRKVRTLQNNYEMLGFLKSLDSVTKDNLLGMGIVELEELLYYHKEYGMATQSQVIFNPTLARGLGYYTGPMWEVYMNDGKSTVKSSIAAGGRWDEMAGKFIDNGNEYPSTGMSFGLDVIHAALVERYSEKSVQKIRQSVPLLLFVPTDQEFLTACMRLSSILRKEGISCDISIGRKVGKAIDHADKEKIPFVVVIGETELSTQQVRLRNMNERTEQKLHINDISLRIGEILRDE